MDGTSPDLLDKCHLSKTDQLFKISQTKDPPQYSGLRWTLYCVFHVSDQGSAV